MRRRILLILALMALAGLGACTWSVLGIPPPRLLVRYGVPPFCEPTGRTRNVEGIEFIEIGRGCFRMGSHHQCDKGNVLGRLSAAFGLPWGRQPKHDSDECPRRWVEFENGFWISRNEITHAQYERLDEEHRRNWKMDRTDAQPVVNVNYEDALEYCDWLADLSGLPIRLPSEAEWECAARAGSDAEYCFGDDEAMLPFYAWYSANSGYREHEVGTRRANAWGLNDLHGNVWEWVAGNYHPNYEGAPADGSAWFEKGSYLRVCRGGGRSNLAGSCRSAYRRGPYPSKHDDDIGFRVVFSLPEGE